MSAESQERAVFRSDAFAGVLISNGDPTMFVTRPVSLVLVPTIAALLLLLVLPAFRRMREEIAD